MGIFDGSEAKTSVVIVADKNHQKYASFLLQLFSSKDDSENKTVGVKDDSVKTAVWTDKEYKASKAKATSINKFIFIGDSKIIRDETANIPRIFKKYGMQYGWLGSRAVLDLDQFYLGFALTSNKMNFANYVVERHKNVGLTDNGRDSVFINQVLIANPFVVKDVQYNCLVECFYLDGAEDFIEE